MAYHGTRAEDLLDRYDGLAARRDQWKPIWQELSELFDPVGGGFTSPMQAGQELQTNIYDSTPMQAKSGLATTIDALIKPPSQKWLAMKAAHDELNEIDGPALWFDTVTDRMWNAIYSPMARFIQQSTAVDNSIATFGLGYLWIDENRFRSGLSFRALPIGQVVIDENADGIVDTVCVSRIFTARQAVQKYGADNLGEKVRETLESTDPKARDKQFEFIQCLYPREERDQRQKDSGNLPIASITICRDDKTVVEESGYHEMPLAAPRWEVAPCDVYPRSRAMIALSDARTLQAIGRTLLIGGEQAVDPAKWVVDDGVMSPVRTFPGGITVVSAETIRDTGGRPMGTLDIGSNIPLGRDMQRDYRDMVGAAFLKNVFTLPPAADAKEMTATEIIQRRDEYLRAIGIMGQLQSDYNGAIVSRVFGLMFRAGAFPPPPPELRGATVRFEYKSPVQAAKRQLEAAGLVGAMQFAAPIIQIAPESADNFDTDAIMRDLPDAFGLRQKWLRSTDGRDELRKQRQQMMEEQQMMAGIATAAETAKTVTQANATQAQADATAAGGRAA